MSAAKHIFRIFKGFALKVNTHKGIDPIKASIIMMTICVVSGSWEASERVIRGQIQGIDTKEGAWVGVVTGAPSYNVSWLVPLDGFESDEKLEGVASWSFTTTGKFELKKPLEEAAVLLVVAKNRLPLEIPLPPNDHSNPIEALLESGVGLKGIVRNQDGIPVEDATVSISPRGRKYEIPSFTKPNWVTGVDGSFFLEGLKEASDYELRVTADGYAPLVAVAAGLKIPKGGIERLEIGLERGYSVSGIVVGDSGLPLADVVVKAAWKQNGMKVEESDGGFHVVSGSGSDRYTTGTKSKIDGSFSVGPFAKGTRGRLYTGSSSIGAAITSEVSAPYSGLVLRIGRESVKGRVLDGASGVPLEEFMVRVNIGESKSHRIESRDGVFDIPVFPIDREGTNIRIVADGHEEWSSQIYGGLNGEYDLGDISLEKVRTIRGIVRNAGTGSPLAAVRVFALPARSGGADTRGAGSFVGFAATNLQGEFTLTRLRQRVDRLSLLVPRTAFATVDIPEGDDMVEIDLDLGGVIEGSLILPNNTPVEGDVAIEGSSWIFPRPIRSNGSFRWEALPPDVYTITATTEAGLVENRTVTLTAGQRLSDVDLVVQPGWSASGTVSGLRGVERVFIEAQDADSRVLIRRGFENGPYTIHGLPTEVTLVARASSGHTFERVFLTGNKQNSTVDFHFNDGSRLTGWLTSGGKPLGGASLQIVPENSGGATINVTTTESGRYEAERVLDGRHVIRTDTGYSSEVDISGDTTFNMDIPENSLTGIVRGERTRRPVGGGLARLQGIHVPEAIRAIQISRRIGSDGTFSFEGLFAGDYDIVVVYPHAEEVVSRVQISGSESIEMLIQCANSRECIEGTSNMR